MRSDECEEPLADRLELGSTVALSTVVIETDVEQTSLPIHCHRMALCTM